ncbi:MAG TPA: DUF3105 domain-containing protein [Candidatus Limnocylindrales bacterium]|nr:DUF3105 domain-containing protein [Candidatus Limnocylindrales bacterium]
MSKESRRAGRNARATTRTSSGPAGSTRAGRRERVRQYDRPEPFLQRYRTAILGVVGVAVAAVVVGLVFVQSTQAAYTCSVEFNPSPTPSPAAGSSQRIGFAQDPMGQLHEVSKPQRYTFCPPASGNHYNQAGLGPITPRVYGPSDNVGPSNWIHNLEHGGLVVLYRGDSEGATEAGQSAFEQFFDTFPPAPICNTPPGRVSPVIGRFDQMAYPYAALVWGRVLPLQEWDPALVLQFYATESVRLDANGEYIAPPEPAAAGCPPASPRPSVAPSLAPAASPSPSGSAAPSGSPAQSQAPVQPSASPAAP